MRRDGVGDPADVVERRSGRRWRGEDAGRNAGAAEAETAGAVDALVVEDVEVAVLRLRRRGHADEDGLRKPEVVGAAQVQAVARADADVEEAGAVAFGLARDDAHSAAERVL